MSTLAKDAVRDTKSAFNFINDYVQDPNIDHTAEVFISEDMMEVGQYASQGDVKCHREAEVTEGAKLITENREKEQQVAPGNSKGSRHIWDSLDGVEIYDLSNTKYGNDPLVGRQYKLLKERTLTHPEHGNFRFPAGMIITIKYQRMFAEERRRALD